MGEPHYLVISDLHLAEDLGSSIRTTEALEKALVTFFDHHRENGGPWKLVINGDMLEMVGIVMLPEAAPQPPGELHPHDARYGLGGREDAAAIKMRAMAEHHASVFRAMARFVGAGNEIAVVIGNHDIELHWPAVQQAFVDGIADGWSTEHPGADPAAIRSRVAFHDWFLYEPGVVWIEHGHQYDPYCSFEHPLAPAIDEVEVDPNIGGLLLRYLGSQFGDEVHAVVHQGAIAYLRLWASQGPWQMTRVFVAYWDMCRRLYDHWRALGREQLEAHGARVERRFGALAEQSGLGRERLEALVELWRPPVANRLGRLLRALMFDRVALLVAAPSALALVLLTPAAYQGIVAMAVTPVVALLVLASAMSREPTDPRRAMRRQAAAVRRIVDVPYVVMGHSHDPVHHVEDDGAYLNTGTWAPRGDPRKTYTHVRIERTPDGARASLRQWRDGAAVGFDPVAATPVAPVETVVETAAV